MNRRLFTKQMMLATSSAFILNGCITDNDNQRILHKGDVVGCFGDSITDAGRNGWVEKLQAMYDEKFPELKIQFRNLGVSGETITGLTESNSQGSRPFVLNRIDKVLEENKMDVAIICYGMNCGIYQPFDQTILDKFKTGMDTLKSKLRKKNIKMILLTTPPLLLKEDLQQELVEYPPASYSWKEPYPYYDRDVLSKFREVVQNSKGDDIVKIINIHDPLKATIDTAYGSDAIHPNQEGYRVIAQTVFDAIAK